MLREVFESGGIDVTVHRRAVDAYDALRRMHPDVLLLDLLALDAELRDTSVVLCSATMDGPQVESVVLRQELSVSLLPKPFDIDQFLGLIAMVLATRRVLPGVA